MSERDFEQIDLSAPELQVRVEFGGYQGIARLKRVGHAALRWEISIHAESGREICTWDGPEVEGNGPVVYTVQDVENAQRQINQAIDQFMWDPMSQA